MSVVGHRISERKAAKLLGLSIETLKRWDKFGISLYRLCNNKRIYYLEDVLNYQIKRGLLPAFVCGTLSSSSTAVQRHKGGGPGRKQ